MTVDLVVRYVVHDDAMQVLIPAYSEVGNARKDGNFWAWRVNGHHGLSSSPKLAALDITAALLGDKTPNRVILQTN